MTHVCFEEWGQGLFKMPVHRAVGHAVLKRRRETEEVLLVLYSHSTETQRHKACCPTCTHWHSACTQSHGAPDFTFTIAGNVSKDVSKHQTGESGSSCSTVRSTVQDNHHQIGQLVCLEHTYIHPVLHNQEHQAEKLVWTRITVPLFRITTFSKGS